MPFKLKLLFFFLRLIISIFVFNYIFLSSITKINEKYISIFFAYKMWNNSYDYNMVRDNVTPFEAKVLFERFSMLFGGMKYNKHQRSSLIALVLDSFVSY
ncbi:hypothetical protein HPP92_023584 [Vanilla planifolia]|uniref:Uncharacterized protein n=1 Tax=Vanilla planifolia TaxID=51239 RepID=A0A835PKV5_VANPL|nr:hypothetical protein HPP92_023584 [Vanilla planifolia]